MKQQTPNPQENWEEEFDDEIAIVGDQGKDIKQFIRQLLSEERKKVVEDVKFFFCHKGNSPQERINNLMEWLNIKEKDLPKL